MVLNEQNLQNFLNGIIHLPFLELSIIILVISRWKFKLVCQQYRAWSDCFIMVAKAKYVRFRQAVDLSEDSPFPLTDRVWYFGIIKNRKQASYSLVIS